MADKLVHSDGAYLELYVQNKTNAKVWGSDSQGLCVLYSISIHRAALSSFNYRRV